MKKKKTKIEEMTRRAKIAATWQARRRKTGHKIPAFAKKYKFDIGQISRWESGEHIPTPKLIRRMESALKREGV